MRRFVFALGALLIVSCAVFAGDVPGVSAADFESPAAGAIWSILAGQGVWGAILFGVLGLLWRIGRPFLEEWARSRRLETLYLAVETGVGGVQATYVEAIKQASQNGKLTEEQKAAAFALCRNYVISFLKTQGIDVIREYGDAILKMLIEHILSRLKINNPAARAVIAPLPDLAPSAPSV